MDNPQDIARTIKSGDERAFERVFKSNYAKMCGYAVKYTNDLGSAEEIVQDVFLTYWDKRSTLEIRGSVDAYLFRSVRNASLNHLKHLQVQNRFIDSHKMDLDASDSPLDKMVDWELQQKITQCIEELPAKRKEVFMLSREEGLKYKEIAERMGISVKTVEVHVGKALKYLRDNLAEYLPVLILALIGLNLLL